MSGLTWAMDGDRISHRAPAVPYGADPHRRTRARGLPRGQRGRVDRRAARRFRWTGPVTGRGRHLGGTVARRPGRTRFDHAGFGRPVGLSGRVALRIGVGIASRPATTTATRL